MSNSSQIIRNKRVDQKHLNCYKNKINVYYELP